ncbi:MAG: hypothetical protein QM758_03960 [Armatimonas sp.]
MPELRFLCVHYHDTKRVNSFVRHLMGLPLPGGWNVRGAICDNSGDWPDWVPLPTGWKVTRPGENLGYLSGCAAANSLFEEPAEWTGIVNTDLNFEGSFLMRLARSRFAEDVMAVGPDLRLCNGRRQNPVHSRRPLRSQLQFYRYLSADHRRSEFIERMYDLRYRLFHPPMRAADVSLKETYALHRAALFLSRRYFEWGGSLNYGSFMYGEEVFLAEETRKQGGKSIWLPGSVVWHEVGKDEETEEKRSKKSPPGELAGSTKA